MIVDIVISVYLMFVLKMLYKQNVFYTYIIFLSLTEKLLQTSSLSSNFGQAPDAKALCRCSCVRSGRPRAGCRCLNGKKQTDLLNV